MARTLELFAGNKSDGSPVLEQVRVEQLGTTTYKLIQSPGLVLGIAAGDTFELLPDRRISVISRGQNLCIQLYVGSRNSALERFATDSLAALGGRLDGESASQLVYTAPVSAGFPAIEEVLREIVSRFPTCEWYYGNVYDPDDGVTPLNWWTQ